MTIISITNEKGGVGKTTTALNIGAGLAKVGKRVLLIDSDQQQTLSRWLGFSPDNKPTLCELIFQEVYGVQTSEYQDFIRKSEHEKIDYIPTTEKLAGIVAILGQSDDSLNILNRVLRHSFFEENYDYIIIDCQPSITLVVSNVLKCADKVLIPVQADEPAYSGVKKLLEKISQIKGDLDISKYILGILLTMDKRGTKVSKIIKDMLNNQYSDFLFENSIPDRVEAKAEIKGNVLTPCRESLINKSKSEIGSIYMNIVNEIIERCE